MTDARDIAAAAEKIKKELINHRRHIHGEAEVGFDLERTVGYVKKILDSAGIEYTDCGRCGITAVIGDKKKNAFLLRADMDALAIKEESGEAFAADNGNMHACGHDMHTAMLLGAARLLKEREKELGGCVKLMFQPSEENLTGARNMIENGVLECPGVSGAMSLHVSPALELDAGTVILGKKGAAAPAADGFTVEFIGKGSHGAMPHKGIDPIIPAAHFVLAAGELISREIPAGVGAVLTVGAIDCNGGINIIPDRAAVKGSMRSFSDETEKYMKKRLEKMARGIGEVFRAKTEVFFPGGCPVLKNDGDLTDRISGYSKELFGAPPVTSTERLTMSGSEDFAYISESVPAVTVMIAAGRPSDGYAEPLHSPRATFDESALPYGAALMAYTAINECRR
ncbi:MAG: amidohydrolase [Clostridia bacterium]|nr:amidohydrolase [Clostridia bacterium]